MNCVAAFLIALVQIGSIYGHFSVTTVVGSGSSQLSENSTADRTALGYTQGIWINSKSDVYLADQNYKRIRVINKKTKKVTTVVNFSNYSDVRVYQPWGLWGDSSDNLYFSCSNHAVYKYIKAKNNITVVAGMRGYAGYNGDNINATLAYLYYPMAVAGDTIGNLYIADRYNQRIRKVNLRTKIITTVAGSGYTGRYGDGLLAIYAYMRYPQGVWVDTNGNLFIADSDNHCIRKVNNVTQIISTIAGLTSYWSSYYGSAGYNGDGELAVNAELNYPVAIVGDTAGNLYIADRNSQRIRMINGTTAIISTVAGNGRQAGNGIEDSFATRNILAVDAPVSYSSAIALDPKHNLFIADNNYRILLVNASTHILSSYAGISPHYNGDGISAKTALISEVYGVWMSSTGILYFSDTNNHRIRYVDSRGTIHTVAGNGLSYSYQDDHNTMIEASNPQMLWGDTLENLYFVDTYNNNVKKYEQVSGLITVVAGREQNPNQYNNNNYNNNGEGNPSRALMELEDVPAVQPYMYIQPFGVYGDSTGILYVTDSNGVIRNVSLANETMGIIAGTLYNSGYSGDGGPATSALLNYPRGLWVDSIGDVYFSDCYNYRIRKVAKKTTDNTITHTITTVAGNGQCCNTYTSGVATSSTLSEIMAVWGDSTGMLYLLATNYHKIYVVDLNSGLIRLIAGSSYSGFNGDGHDSLSTRFYYPQAMCGAKDGSLFIADTNNYRIRKVFANNVTDDFASSITTIAGIGPRPAGDGGPATSASLYDANAVWGDTLGDILIADYYAIRKVAKATGIISDFIGTGSDNYQYTVDGVFANQTTLYSPQGLWGDTLGNVYYSFANCVRVVNETTQRVHTVAGTCSGYLNSYYEYYPATMTGLNNPGGVFGDTVGNLFIADTYNHRIRNMSLLSGLIHTAAGSPSCYSGHYGDGNLATYARLYYPRGVWVDRRGNMFIADTNNHMIRMVNGTTHIIYRYAGIYCYSTYCSGSFNGDGFVAPQTYLSYPYAVYGDFLGNIYVSDSQNYRIRMVNHTTSIVHTVAGTGSSNYQYISDVSPATSTSLGYSQGIWLDSTNSLYICDNAGKVWKSSHGLMKVIVGGDPYFSYDNIPATSALIGYPNGAWQNSLGDVYFTDGSSLRVRKVSASGIISTVAGNGTEGSSYGENMDATSVAIYYPETIWGNSAGIVYFSDSGVSFVRKLNTLSGTLGSVQYRYQPSHSYYYNNHNNFEPNARRRDSEMLPEVVGGSEPSAYSTSSSPASSSYAYSPTSSYTSSPSTPVSPSYYSTPSVAFTSSPQVYYSPNSNSPHAAYSPGSPSYSPHNYYGPASSSPIFYYNPSSPTGSSSNSPVAYSPSGPTPSSPSNNYYSPTIPHSGSPSQYSPSYYSSPSYSSSSNYYEDSYSNYLPNVGGIWGDSLGNMYYSMSNYCQVKMIDVNFTLSVVVGMGWCNYYGDDELYYPYGLWGDSVGQFLYIADRGRSRIRRLDLTSGVISTIAGSNQCCDIGGYVPTNALEVYLNSPMGVWGDDAGQYLFVADTGNNVIRRLDLFSGKMETVAGTGAYDYNGDNNQATSANIGYPMSVWGNTLNQIYVADDDNQRIRMIQMKHVGPSYAPSRHPTPIPSRAPTEGSKPSVKPSAAPTLVPTQPSVAPSVAPTLGALMSLAPTKTPTVAPTISELTLWKTKLQSTLSTVSKNMTSSSAVVTTQTYYELEVAGTEVYGSCSSWTVLVGGSLTTTGYLYRPSALQFTTVPALTSVLSSVVCSDSTAVGVILNALTGGLGVNHTSTDCFGHTWVTKKCSTAVATAPPALCVDCTDPCSASIHCDAVTNKPYSLSCVADSCSGSSVKSGIRVFSVAYQESKAAPSIVQRTITSTKTTMTVSLILSSAGTAYCGVFAINADGTSAVISDISQIKRQNFVSSRVSNVTSVVLTGLSAATSYQLYCLTVSSFGSTTALSTMISSATIVSTLCCKTVSVQLNTQSVLENTGVTKALTISLSAAPQYGLQLSIVGYKNTSSNTTVQMLYPVLFTVTSQASGSGLTLTASLAALSVGYYNFRIALSGASVNEYAVTYVNNRTTVAVLSAYQQPATPVLMSAVFSNDGSYITVSFDSSTNKGGLSTSFACSQLFNFTCAATSTCQWSSSSNVLLFVTNNEKCAVPGQQVTLLNSAVVKALCQAPSGMCPSYSTWSPVAVKSLTIKAPDSPTPPSVVISMPSVIGGCDSLTIDVTGSSGSGGRSWKSVKVVASGVEGLNTTALQRFLDRSYRFSPPSAISNGLLTKGQTYNFVVTLCSFLGACSSNSGRVTVLNTVIPSVSLPGSALRTITTSSQLSVTSLAYIAACDGSTTQFGLSYAWSVSQSGQQVLSLVSTSKDPSKLVLPAFKLTPSLMYDVSLTATISATLKSASASTQIYVQPGSIVALISGGASRSLRVGTSIVIDGSSSYDEDVSGATGARAGLNYLWDCYQTAPTYSETCDSIFDAPASSTEERYTVSAKSTSSSVGAVLTMTISDSANSRTSSASVTVSVLSQRYPLVSVVSNLAANGVMNGGDTLKLTATVGLPSAVLCNLTWSVDDTSSFTLSKVAVSPLSMTLSSFSGLSTASQLLYLAIGANSLPVGFTLTFSLTANIYSENTKAVASVTVMVNSPPQPGSFAVTPVNGTALLDKFTFAAAQWHDNDLPLTYQFGYVSGSGQFVALQSKSESTYGQTPLPAGLETNLYAVSCVAQIFDFYNANASMSQSVVVVKGSALNYTQTQNYIASTLASGGASANGIKQSTALANYVLNAVNCSAAPPCAALHRQQCYKTINTCGPCISDEYVGDSDGDSNVACVAKASFVPQSTARPCINNCSDAGVCMFINKNTGNFTSECKIFDTSCSAICVCQPHRQGDLCQFTDEEAAAKQHSRQLILDGLSNLIALEDADQQSVAGWIGIASETSQASDELSNDAAVSLVSTASSIIDGAAQVGLSTDSVLSVLITVNAALQAVNSNYQQARRLVASSGLEEHRRLLAGSFDQLNSVVSGSQDSLAKYLDLVVSNMVPGQNPVQAVLDQFRINAVVQPAAGSAVNVSIYLPLTALELLSGIPVSSVQVPTGGNSSADALSMSVQSIVAQAYSGSVDFNSNPVMLHLSSAPCSSGDCNVEVVLQNTHSVYATSVVPEFFNATCASGSDIVSYNCMSGVVMHIPCNGSTGIMRSRCSESALVPSCNSLLGVTATTSSNGCRTVSYSTSNVTCSCPIDLMSSRRVRRRLTTGVDDDPTADDDTRNGNSGYSVSYVAMLNSVEKSFVSTVVSADHLNAKTVEKGWKVLVTIGAFIAFTGVSMFMAHKWDHEDEEAKKSKTVVKAKSSALLKISRTSAAADRKTAASVAAHRATPVKNAELAMIEQALPQILSSQSFSTKCLNEVKHYHRWIGVIFFYSDSFPRILRVLSLSTTVVSMLFVQSITYNLVNPDDGSCETLHDRVSCLQPNSAFATGEPKCSWVPNATKKGTCVFNQPEHSIKLILFVAIFSALVSTPIALSVDLLIKKVLSAPTRKRRESTIVAPVMVTDQLTGTVKRRSTASTGRGVVMVNTVVVPEDGSRPSSRPSSARASTIIESTSSDRSSMSLSARRRMQTMSAAKPMQQALSQITKLGNEIRKYRQGLTPEQLEEFDALWGLDAEGTFLSGTLGTQEAIVGHKRLWNSFKRLLSKTMGSQQSLNVYQSVIADLRKVDQDFSNESKFFDSSKFSVREKGKRLLFLFQCDLLPGISGKILESKGSRDFEKPNYVLLRTKIASWAFVILLNLGMWFYILLFALNQTKHRQDAWFNSFILWLIVEVVLISTVMALITHVVIPSVIMKDVTKIKQKLLENFRDYYQKNSDGKTLTDEQKSSMKEEESSASFNAAKYLFVSTRLALSHPELKEAKVISVFSTPWPKRSYQHINEISKGYGRRFSAITKSISIILVFLLTNLLNIPSTFQDMIVHLAATSTIGYTILLHVELFHIFPVLAFGPFLVACAVVHFAVQSGRSSAKLRLAKLMPITSGHVENNGAGGTRSPRTSTLIAIRKGSQVTFAPPKVMEYIEGIEPAAGDVELAALIAEGTTALNQPMSGLQQQQKQQKQQKQQHTTRRASTVQGVNVLRQLYEINEEEHEEDTEDQQQRQAEDGEEQEEEEDEETNWTDQGLFSDDEYDERHHHHYHHEDDKAVDDVRAVEPAVVASVSSDTGTGFQLDLEIERSMKRFLSLSHDTFAAVAASPPAAPPVSATAAVKGVPKGSTQKSHVGVISAPRSQYSHSDRDDDSISYCDPEHKG